MSKKQKTVQSSKTITTEAAPDKSRRTLLLLGGGALVTAVAGAVAYNAGVFDGEKPKSFASEAVRPTGQNLAPTTLAATRENALRAADELLTHYARDLANASALIHAVRGMGRGFKLNDGTSAVDHLCTKYAFDKDVDGKRYVYFSRDAEVHENSFLKTFLEAGVSLEQKVTASGKAYTLRDMIEGGKQLFRADAADVYKFDDRQFRFDPASTLTHGRGELLHEHLPWSLIAFANLMKPAEASWTNAYNEKIDLPAVLDRALAEYETTCALGQAALARGEISPLDFRTRIKEYSCFGLHSVYGFLACWQKGFTANNLPQRMTQVMDFVTYRLQADALASDVEYDEADAKAPTGQKAPPQVMQAFKLRARVKLLGHAFESINFIRKHQLMTFTPAQEKRIQVGEQALYESIVGLRALDWASLRRMPGEKFISDVVIALGHAARGMKLLTAQNPDVVA